MFAPPFKDLPARALWSLLPGTCVLCGLATGRRMDLCRVCEADLPRSTDACPRCALPLLAGDAGVCGRCLAQPPPWRHCHAAFLYGSPADLLVRALKYHSQRPAGRVMAELMLAKLAGVERPQALVAVPMPRWRRWRRGFNQSELLAQALGAHLEIAVATGLVRRRDARPPQATLPPAARRLNARGAFTVNASAPRHVAIVDDVATTGSTLAAMTRVLHQAGARRVDVWLFARTPE